MAGPHLSLLDVQSSPVSFNSVKSQLQLIKHVLTNPSRQLSVKQARLPLGSKNTSVQICQLHKKNPLLTSGSPPPPPLGIRWCLRKPNNACSIYLNFLKHEHSIMSDK